MSTDPTLKQHQRVESSATGSAQFPENTRSWLILPANENAEILAIQMQRPARTAQILFWSIIALIAAAIAWAAFSPVSIVIRAPGMIRPATDLQTFRSPINGVLDSLFVSDNSFVARGDTLAIFNAGEFTAQRSLNSIEQQQLGHETGSLRQIINALPDQPSDASAPLRAEVQFGLPKYQAEYTLIRKDMQIMADQLAIMKSKRDRLSQLMKKNFSSTEEYESAASEAHLQELKMAQYIQDRRQKFTERLYELEQRLTNARREQQNIGNRIATCYLIANVSGTVTSMKIQKAGLFFTAGQELFSISPEQELHAEIYVNPRDAGLLREQLPVYYSIEAFSYNDWEILRGSVRQVSRDITLDERDGKPYYKVICTFDRQSIRYKKGKNAGTTASLKKGLPVQANIVIGQKKMLEMLYDRTVDFFAL